MPEVQTLTKTRITGEIKRIRFENPDTGFVVFTLICDGKNEFTCKGEVPGIRVGLCMECDGYFENHPEFGRQFKIDSFRIVPPSTADGIARFLRHSIPGIGPKTAAAIVKKFGVETVKVLDLIRNESWKLKISARVKRKRSLKRGKIPEAVGRI